MKKLLKVLLVVLMVLSVAACSSEQKVGGKVILGDTTELSGDFIWPGLGGSSAGASDQAVNRLISGYATMETNQGGNYVWNTTVVKDHKEEEVQNEGGLPTFKITITINSGLKDSKGTEIKAANYLAYTLAMSSPVAAEALEYNRSGYSLVGWPSFSKYDGVEGTGTKEFAGLRLIDEYTFSIEINSDNYPYYYADTFGAFSPEDLGRVLGEGVEVKDDGKGAYLSGSWYEKNDDGTHKKAALLKDSRFNYTDYGFTGPYVLESYSDANKEAVLKLNPNYAGNFEGQKPSIETIVYRKAVEETQIAQLKSGELDVIAGLTGGEQVNAALALTKGDNKMCDETHYDRAGYGKIEFECDFGPTMFTEVRQAIAYCLDRNDFSNTFCEGYGSIVNGPYSVNFDGYVANEAEIDKLNAYAVSAASAKKVLEEGGWVYNADGTAYTGTGVRYKKLAKDEYGPKDVNLTYKSLENTDGIEYKTTKVGDDYYLPLAINWFSSEGNSVSDLLNTKLLNGTLLGECGIVLRQTIGSFTSLLGEIYRDASYGYDGNPKYGMMNLATGWNSATYDYSYTWIGDTGELDGDIEWYDEFFEYSSNKLTDAYDKEFSWFNKENQGLTYDQAVAKSGGKLGMNYISFAMVYSVKPGDETEFNKWFLAYMQRWNELLPDIPLYCNVYYDVYNSKIKGFKTTPFFGPDRAILYCTVQ